MNSDAGIFVAGHRGLVGSAILRALTAKGFARLLVRASSELDLRCQSATNEFFSVHRPEYVIDAAARVGGIHANNIYPAEFIRDNLQIQTNLIDSAYRHGARKFCFLGSSCIYPRLAPQPIRESSLLTGPLEPTNEWYAVAKIAGIKMCQAYRRQFGFNAISLMPTNLYGPGDNFDLASSHVLPALLRKFHEAKLNGQGAVEVWGSGQPRREFLHVDDLADAVIFFMDKYDDEELVNIGVGVDVSISELALLIKDVVGFAGEVLFDRSKPDGTPQKLLDVAKATSLGWSAKIALRPGVEATYQWFRAHLQNRC